MDEAPPSTASALAPLYKDRKTGLIIFGSFEILLGCLAGGLIGLMIFGQVMMARGTHQPTQFRMIVPGALFYAGVAAALISLGIGSILGRRWARALSLILAWAWLLTGLVTMAVMALFLPEIFRNAFRGGPGMPPGALTVALVTAFVTVGILFLLVPGVLVFFFGSKHVKSTCEARDPNPRWTDACPLPVLALSLWLLISAIYMLGMPFLMNGVLPVFGVLLSGWSGSLAYVFLAGIFGYGAAAVYRLESAGWWLIFVGLILASVSAWVSFAHIDIFEMYREMGYPENQIALMRQFNFLSSRNVGLFALAGAVPLLFYLLFVKRYFRLQTDTVKLA